MERRRIGPRTRNPERAGGSFCLLFHDTHHRAVTAPWQMARYDLSQYDGVLAFGEAVRQIYLKRKWASRAWTWHEAADTRVFQPIRNGSERRHLVWIGNWGDDERTEELEQFLFRPVAARKWTADVHGVRYPEQGLAALQPSGIQYRGWLPNHRVPHVFSRYRATVHIPRRPYKGLLQSIPTIRVFEALACGIPLVSAPWDDVEGLFAPNRDFLVAEDGEHMMDQLERVFKDPSLAARLTRHGRNTVLTRHTCAHRARELARIVRDLGVDTAIRPARRCVVRVDHASSR